MSLSPSPFLTSPSLTAATRTALSPAAVSAGTLGLYRCRRTLRSAAIAIAIDLAAVGKDLPEDYGSMFLAKNPIRRRRAGVLHHPPRCRGRTGSEISAARPSSSWTGSTSPAALCGRFFHFPRLGGSRMSMDRRMQASFQMRRYRWRALFALDTGGGEDSLNRDSAGVGRTRLGTIVGALARQLLEKLNATRKNFPTKIFLLLLGFYTANALATILGQTGDWDVLVAGVVVAAIEGIGALMYRNPFSIPHSLIVMVNYWKAGVCLGLFVDAFKLGS